MPFEPKGEVAQWRVLYRVFQSTDVGETITYQQLGEVLDVDPRTERHRIQAAARKAGQQLLRKDDRAVEVVPDEGYRVVPAGRQIAMAGGQIERATHSLDKGKDLTTHIRMDELSTQEQQIVQTMAVGFAQVAEWARQIGRRVEDHEGRLSDIEAELKRIRADRSRIPPGGQPVTVDELRKSAGGEADT
jgi:hypothetical protein